MATVSVIVPCYNYGRFLGRCVDSVLSQEGVDVAVLVIDDASPDGSGEVAADLGRRDPRVRVVRHERNRGHIATYNEGLTWADREYLLLLSADDHLTPGALSRATRLMEAHPEVGFVYGRALPHSTDTAGAGDASPGAGARLVPGRRWIAERCRRMDNPVPTPTAVVRTSVQHRLGGYRADSPYAGDLEMWLRLAAYADVGELHADQAIYRRHGANMSAGWHSALEVTFEHSRRAYETVLTEHADVISGATRLRGVVRRQVARRALRMATNRYCRGRGDASEIAWLESHAADVHGHCGLLPEWWAVQACKRMGPRAAGHVGPAVDTLRGALGRTAACRER
jgi:glycosyltransferase involved in cell wall biosynthesis